MTTSILDNISKKSCDSDALTKEYRADNDCNHDDAGSDDDETLRSSVNSQHSGNT